MITSRKCLQGIITRYFLLCRGIFDCVVLWQGDKIQVLAKSKVLRPSWRMLHRMETLSRLRTLSRHSGLQRRFPVSALCGVPTRFQYRLRILAGAGATREVLRQLGWLMEEVVRGSQEKVGLAQAAYDSVCHHLWLVHPFPRALTVVIRLQGRQAHTAS